MSCNNVVLVKQVPDTANVTEEVMRPDGTVNRSKLPAVFNPEDKVALELALQLRDRYGGTVTAVTMGPPKASELLRECLYMGADDVVLVTDRKFAAADTLATSYVLAATIRKLGPFDIVFAGRQAIDGDTAQVGPQTAEKLGIPQITYAEQIVSFEGQKVIVRRRIDGGYELLECPTPLLITVIKEAATPRPFGAKRQMAKKSARTLPELEALATSDGSVSLEDRVAAHRDRNLYIRTLSAADLDVDVERCGLAGSPTKVKSVASVVLAAEGHREFSATKEGINSLLDNLMGDRVFG